MKRETASLTASNKFSGYDTFIVYSNELIPEDFPKRIRPIDSGKLIDVNFDLMTLKGDADDASIRLNQLSVGLTKATSSIFYYVVIHALNGRRKISTVKRWINQFSMFIRVIKELVPNQISCINLAMFNWFNQDKSPSSQKLLRSFIKYWIGLNIPGIDLDLKSYIKSSKSPKPKSTINIQNSNPQERPFSMQQTRNILTNVESLYISGEFNPQDYLMWRLIISEAMRPSQLQLLEFGDLKIDMDINGNLVKVQVNVPIVKQKATPAREYMMEYTLSEPIGRAVVEHIKYISSITKKEPERTLPIFCIARKGAGKQVLVNKNGINITSRIMNSRKYIAGIDEEPQDLNLFTRRFKHTKLTHLAMLGAPLEVLARAGFQTSTGSLTHYVNLTEEAFVNYENQLSSHHENLLSAFRGKVINKNFSTNPDLDHRILDPDIDKDVGSCSTKPCNVLTPFGCYICPRFEAFKDGAHQAVLDSLLSKKNKLIKLKLPLEAITRDDYLIDAVSSVISSIKEQNG